jgi:hypothetical protein
MRVSDAFAAASFVLATLMEDRNFQAELPAAGRLAPQSVP